MTREPAKPLRELHPAAQALAIIASAAIILAGVAVLAIAAGWLWKGVQAAWT